ncbi:MAG: helix-turn-helix domain-containing protein [Thermodesulfobacteriota bacterium]
MNFDEVWGRIRKATDLTSFTELAAAVGVQQSAVSKVRKKGEFPPGWIFSLATRYGLTSDWVARGEGPMRRGETAPAPQQPSQSFQPQQALPAAGEFHLSMGDSMELLVNIHKSGNNVLIRAINANLMAFNEAIENRERAETTVNAIAEMREQMNIMKGEIANLRQENQALQRKLLPSDDRETQEAAG